MTTSGQETTSQEITDLNLNYILLAQKMLKKDRDGGKLLLGLSDEVADMLIGMTLGQVVKLATNNFVLCVFRLGEMPVARVFNASKTAGLQQAHVSIVLASRNTGQMALAA